MKANYNIEKLLHMSDKEIVETILNRDKEVTFLYLYRKCYPIFSAAHRKYYTDCETPTELINEIYIYILNPNKKTGKCKLADFGFRCTLTMWIRIIVENYCHQLFAKKKIIIEDILNQDDRNPSANKSIDIDINVEDFEFNNLIREDVVKLLNMMPNKRYRQLLIYRYLEEMSNEETAKLLALTMANYYNVHLRAKAQFYTILEREGLI